MTGDAKVMLDHRLRKDLREVVRHLDGGRDGTEFGDVAVGNDVLLDCVVADLDVNVLGGTVYFTGLRPCDDRSVVFVDHGWGRHVLLQLGEQLPKVQDSIHAVAQRVVLSLGGRLRDDRMKPACPVNHESTA